MYSLWRCKSCGATEMGRSEVPEFSDAAQRASNSSCTGAVVGVDLEDFGVEGPRWPPGGLLALRRGWQSSNEGGGSPALAPAWGVVLYPLRDDPEAAFSGALAQCFMLLDLDLPQVLHVCRQQFQFTYRAGPPRSC